LLASPDVFTCTKTSSGASFGLQASVEFFGHPQAVERLEFAGKAGHQPGLVGLQMADDRPLQVGQIRHGFPFAVGFLHLVLTQEAQPRGMRKTDARLVHGLADRQQANRAGSRPAR
jgi:hypothetical protein